MRKFALAVAALLFAPLCFAQPAGTVELTPTVGYWFGDTLARGITPQFDFDVNIDDAPAYGLRLGYKFSDTWGIEGGVFHERADLSTGHNELFGGRNKIGNIDLTTGEIGFAATFGHNRLLPFIAGGIGAQYMNPDLAGMSSDTRFAGHFGGGFKVFFNPQVALRFDGRWHWINVGNGEDCHWWESCDTTGDWIRFGELSLGLSFVF